MNEALLQQNLPESFRAFALDLQYLYSQQVLTKLDVQKMKAQAEVSKDAMLSARDDEGFDDWAKEKLLNALSKDFDLTLQKSLDEAVARKGERALIIYKLSRVDRRIYSRANQRHISASQIDKLQDCMQILKYYIFNSYQEMSRWGGNSIDVRKITDNYEQVLREYLDDVQRPVRLQG